MLRILNLAASQTYIPSGRHNRRRPIACDAVAEFAPSVDRRSLYEVLRVKRTASQTEIKTAYRTLAKLYHPDATARFMDSPIATDASSSAAAAAAAVSDPRDFIEIHNAYATLSDPDARAAYDSDLNVVPRWRRNAAGESGFRSPGRGRFYPTRRWETDQCW